MNAVEYFNSGFNCAESVLLASVERQPNVPRVATPFGGGMGRTSEVCGALTGASMAIGIKHGRDEPDVEKRNKAYALVQTLFMDFEAKFGSVICRELTGCDLRTEEGMKRFNDDKIHENKCALYVGFAEEWVKRLE